MSPLGSASVLRRCLLDVRITAASGPPHFIISSLKSATTVIGRRPSTRDFAERDVMECQAASLRLDARELDYLCPFLRFGCDISAELRGGENHRYGADFGEP
jgi:hypothetical protein